MKKEFDDIIAVVDDSSVHCSIFQDYMAEDNVVWCDIKLYGIPTGLSEIQVSQISEGDFKETIYIGNLTGHLIICKQILDMDDSPYDVCDEISGELEYVMSALQEDGAPLSTEIIDIYKNVFYINELEMQNGYDNADLKITILENAPKFLYCLYHVFPDILAYFPRALPYEEDKLKKIKKDMAVIASREILNKTFDKKNENNSEFEFMLDNEQINYILGRRNSGESYPETAKDKPVWDFYESAGFTEINNSRLLYKLSD